MAFWTIAKKEWRLLLRDSRVAIILIAMPFVFILVLGLSLGEVRGRFPHELSGGQLQRVAIARALLPRPALLVADEPVSMIDASLRASIVNLLRDLCRRDRVSIVYITHDLATAYYVSDRIIIMRRGEVVESGAARAVLDNPQHPYSQLLKSSVLSPEVPSIGAVRHA